MPHRSSGQHYRADSGRMVQTEAARSAAPRAHAPHSAPHKTDYTLGHSGRQVRIAPVTFWIAVGSLVIMAGWSLSPCSQAANALACRPKRDGNTDEKTSRSEGHPKCIRSQMTCTWCSRAAVEASAAAPT